jgi:hypothetical protein
MGQYKIQIFVTWHFGISIEYRFEQLIIKLMCLNIYLGLSEFASGYKIFSKEYD